MRRFLISLLKEDIQHTPNLYIMYVQLKEKEWDFIFISIKNYTGFNFQNITDVSLNIIFGPDVIKYSNWGEKYSF